MKEMCWTDFPPKMGPICGPETSVAIIRRCVTSQKIEDLIYTVAEAWIHTYRCADKSLTRPGRKQARKHVRDERGFNNIETQAAINFFFSCKARGRRKFTPFWQNPYLVSFLVRLRTYQHPYSFVPFRPAFSLLHTKFNSGFRVDYLENTVS